jgi:hypothetical protein
LDQSKVSNSELEKKGTACQSVQSDAINHGFAPCSQLLLMNLAVKTSEFSCLMRIRELQEGSPAKGSFFYTDFPSTFRRTAPPFMRYQTNPATP